MKKRLISSLFLTFVLGTLLGQAGEPFPGFTFSPTGGGQAPLTITLTNLSTPNATSFVWQFPGGTPSSSTAQHPTVTYNTPGDFSITLTASNAMGSNTVTQTNVVHVTGGGSSTCSFDVSDITVSASGGNVTVVVTDEDGCTATATLNVTVTGGGTGCTPVQVISFPEDITISNTTSPSFTVVIADNPANHTFAWTPTFPPQMGMCSTCPTYFIWDGNLSPAGSPYKFEVIIDAATACWQKFTFYVTVVPGSPTPVIEPGGNDEIGVAIKPNPSSGEFLVEVPAGIYYATVTDESGRVAKNQNINGDFSLDISSEPQGIYFLTITSTDGRRTVSQLVKQ